MVQFIDIISLGKTYISRTLYAFKFTSNLLSDEACSISIFHLDFFYKDYMYKLTENLRNLV